MHINNADLLIQNLYIVTFDADNTIIPDGALVIRDGVIVDRGTTTEINARWTASERIFGSGQIAIPGLTDAHFHTAQTLMRGLISSLQAKKALRVPTWREYYLPFEAQLSPEDIELSGDLAYATMLQSGTTNVLEAGGPHPARMAAAAQQVGIRATITESTMDRGSRIPASMVLDTEEAIARNVAIADALPKDPEGKNRVTGGMSLRQVITCSTELVTELHREASERNIKIHTHLLEGTYEIDYCLERYGHRPVNYLKNIGVFDSALHGAHSVLTNDEEISDFARLGVSACHCAKGNYSIGSPPALRMWRHGVNIGIGSDGVANLGTLDIFRISMLTRVGQQLVEATPSHNRNGVNISEPLSMAIVGGARAAGHGQHTGSLESGKRADVVLVSMLGPDAAGYTSPEAFLFECASGQDVTSVFVDGVAVVRNRELTTIDLERVRALAKERQRKLIETIA